MLLLFYFFLREGQFIKDICIYVKDIFLVMLMLCLMPGASGAQGFRVWLSESEIHFSINEKVKDEIEENKMVKLFAVSRQKDWALNYFATPLEGRKGEIPAECLLINTPHTKGFMPAHIPRLVAIGGLIKEPGQEIAQIEFKFLLEENYLPGEYKGRLISPEGGPPLNIKLVISPKPAEIIRRLSVENISFQASQRVLIYTARAKAPIFGPRLSGLILQKKLKTEQGDVIPAKRISINNRPLSKILKGKSFHFRKRNLRFSVTTNWMDTPGRYSGLLQFIYEDGQKEDLFMDLVIQPSILMDVDPDHILFNVYHPGLHKGDQPIKVFVGTNIANWNIAVEADPLTIDDGTGKQIDNGALFIKCKSEVGRAKVMLKKKRQYTDLSKKRDILRGPVGKYEEIGTVFFKLHTTMDNEAGSYKGPITFTCMPDW